MQLAVISLLRELLGPKMIVKEIRSFQYTLNCHVLLVGPEAGFTARLWRSHP